MVWALSGDYALKLRGIDTDWHVFELLTEETAFEAADKVLTRLGMRHEEEGPAAHAVSYHFDGADILLLAGQVAGDAPVAVEADQTATVLGVEIPLLKAEEQLRVLEAAGKEKQAEALRALLA